MGQGFGNIDLCIGENCRELPHHIGNVPVGDDNSSVFSQREPTIGKVDGVFDGSVFEEADQLPYRHEGTVFLGFGSRGA